MKPEVWMFIGYSIIWVGLILFVMNLQRRQKAVEDRLDDLERAARKA